MEKKLNLNGYKCPILVNKVSGVPIVFLHGLSYSIEIWQRLGITDLLDTKHIPYLALDMPYGEKNLCKPKTRDIEKNVTLVYDAIANVFGNHVPPVIVGPSIGGNMALHFATRFPVKGLILIGPTRTLEENLPQTYRNFKFPTTIIWGSEDSLIASEDMRTLTDKLPNSKLIIYQGAKHSAYKDKPEQFKRDLLELYIKAEN
ncbi:MAG: alpha/beta hydrolase [Nitrososphaerota archaeon]|jgi:pimeloyl-ACP methyl ester carboxylesterase|nr:alpha/beta hydrolase [Nitrososphaerota archaeon]